MAAAQAALDATLAESTAKRNAALRADAARASTLWSKSEAPTSQDVKESEALSKMWKDVETASHDIDDMDRATLDYNMNYVAAAVVS